MHHLVHCIARGMPSVSAIPVVAVGFALSVFVASASYAAPASPPGQVAGTPGVYVELSTENLPMGAVSSGQQYVSEDPRRFCYFSDKRYSEGARLNGQVCTRLDDSNGGNSLSTVTPPLQWVAPSVAAARPGRGKR